MLFADQTYSREPIRVPSASCVAVTASTAALQHAAHATHRNRGHVRPAALLLLLMLWLNCVDGVPKVKQQLNVHGHKDDVTRSPNAAPPEQVAKLYLAVLGRPVDDHGAAHYQSGKGYGLAQIADELLNSVEFRSKYSADEMVSNSIPVEYAQAAMFADVLSSEMRVTELDLWYLYSRLFDRQPDERALAAYKPIIEEQSLALIDMISDMMRSDEFGIAFLYQRILGRKADDYGKRHYAELALHPVEDSEESQALTVAQGLSLAQVADELLQSQEFTERAATAAKTAGVDASSGKPLMWAQAAEFCDELSHFAATSADLRYLYTKLLGRAPGNLEIENHRERPTNVLGLVVEILHSDEFLNSLADQTSPGAVRAQNAGYLALLGMTKLQMQAAGQEDAADQDGANAASVLCTRTSINENLDHDWTSELDVERLAAYFVQNPRPSVDGNIMMPGKDSGDSALSDAPAPTAVDYARASSALARHEGV